VCERRVIITVLYFIISGFSLKSFPQTQNHNSCDSPEAKQFDFWIGDWSIDQEILQKSGEWLKLKAETKVSRVWDGCALIENWKGNVQFFWEGMDQPEKMRGYSLRYFDAVKKKWTITWYDDRSQKATFFEGIFVDSVGKFYRNSTSTEGKDMITRIIFSDISASFVKWQLSVSNDNGKSWTLLWAMNMRKKE